MINWKTFEEWPELGTRILVLVNDHWFSALVKDKRISDNGLTKELDWLLRRYAKWEYLDQIQSKQPDRQLTTTDRDGY